MGMLIKCSCYHSILLHVPKVDSMTIVSVIITGRQYSLTHWEPMENCQERMRHQNQQCRWTDSWYYSNLDFNHSFGEPQTMGSVPHFTDAVIKAKWGPTRGWKRRNEYTIFNGVMIYWNTLNLGYNDLNYKKYFTLKLKTMKIILNYFYNVFFSLDKTIGSFFKFIALGIKNLVYRTKSP